MEEWTHPIERLGVVQALKTSFLAYPLVNAAHILAIGALVTSVILIDLRLLGWLGEMPEWPFVRLMRRIAICAFVVAALTGIAMFAVRASDYAASPLFWVKMTLILLAGLNFLAFLLLDRSRMPGAATSPAARFSIAMSLSLWPAVLIAGRFLGFL